MKRIVILIVAIAALSACGSNAEFEKQKTFVETQLKTLDTVSNFGSLMAFEENFMKGASQFEGTEKLSLNEEQQIHALLDSLSAKMRQKAIQVFPVIDSLPEEIVEKLK